MTPPGNVEKARRYLSLLDAARCEGKWSELPELARKVEKHAPTRKCLATTARAEAQIATQPSKRPKTGVRPNTATATDNPLLHLARELESAIAIDKEHAEDRYQAQTCLSWLYWNHGDYSLAKSSAPTQLPESVGSTEKASKLMDWSYVCAVKSAFFRASSEEAIGRREDIQTVYETCLQSLEALPSTPLGSIEYHFWWERFFSRCCGCFYGAFQESTNSKNGRVDPRLCLRAFRSWAKYWGSAPSYLNEAAPASAVDKCTQRRIIWKSYYNVLSQIVQFDYVYTPPSSTPDMPKGEKASITSSRRKLLYTELRKVEKVYEGILLKDVSFPEANNVNHEVDDWIDTVMSNWAVLCSSEWQEDDLGEGGKDQVDQNALEILYRAATRSFHSTSVLRHLFTVHTVLAEFDLAGKALDSYLEIVTKGKSRVEKTGTPEPGLDSDEIMLQTIAAGIEMLCEFGKRKEVHKSTFLATRLEKWLADHETTSTNELLTERPQQLSLAAEVYTSVHKAVAISKASWARLTSETGSRAKLQSEAISHFRTSLRGGRAAEEDPAVLYALALVLAETRNIEGAIAAIKQALAAESRVFTEPVDQRSFVQDLKSRVSRKQTLIECWHLLVLLLSSRQEFETAEVACRTTLDPFEPARSPGGANDKSSTGFFDKRQIIEIKMTQMALAEINEGTENAVNAAAELLALYTKFFDIQKPPPKIKTENPPQTAHSTVKSFRGSIFGRHKNNVRDSALSLRSRRPSDETSRAPTIAITEDSSQMPDLPNQTLQVSRSPSHKLHKRPSKRNVRRSRTVSPARSQGNTASEAGHTPELPRSVNGDRPDSVQPPPRPPTATTVTSYNPSEVGIAVTHDLRASVAAQFDSLSVTTLPPPLQPGAKSQSQQENHAEPDFFLEPPTTRKPPFNIPPPFFSAASQHRFSVSLLNQIWLFVAALYRRAGMLEDARQAVDEAFKQAKLVETATVASGTSSVKEFEEPCWGGMPSVEEIWADAYAEVGHLCLAERDPHEAMIKYEGALSHYPDHPAATVGLATLLLDVYEKKIPLQAKKPSLAGEPKPKAPENDSTLPVFPKFPNAKTESEDKPMPGVVNGTPALEDRDPPLEEPLEPAPPEDPWSSSPEALDLLAARDRAYGLLSALTKLGTAWDNSDAWFALARAYELGGQADKAQEVLWWVVELEEKRPVRHWSVLGQGYKLRH